jgi:hypothetical protein
MTEIAYVDQSMQVFPTNDAGSTPVAFDGLGETHMWLVSSPEGALTTEGAVYAEEINYRPSTDIRRFRQTDRFEGSR